MRVSDATWGRVFCLPGMWVFTMRMTPEEFKHKQKKLGLGTNQEMADLLCCHRKHVEGMRGGWRPVAPVYQRIIEQALAINIQVIDIRALRKRRTKAAP